MWLVGVVSHNVLNWQKREVEYDKYQLDKLTSAKSEFRILLKESKLITYKSHDLVRESDRHYNDIIDMLKVRGVWCEGVVFMMVLLLQKDKRYLVLDCVADEREDMLQGYLEEIHRRGPPPPPTATFPGERKRPVIP